MARLIIWLLRVVGPPVAAWIQTQVFGRVPAAPFLEWMPARTSIGRSLTMASLLAGALGLAFYASLVAGTWVIVVALIGAGILAVGCSRAIASFWWPVALAGALLALGVCLVYLPTLSPWASVIDTGSQQVTVLAGGSVVVFLLAAWSSVVMVGALRRLEALQQQP